MHIFERRCRRFSGGGITFQTRRLEIRLQDIESAIRIIREQLRVSLVAEVACPDDALCVNVCSVPHPFVLKDVMRRITHEYEQLSGNGCEFASDCDAPMRVTMIDDIPAFEGLKIL